MNEKPILFSGPMVRAILDGSKTQTRRIIKPQPDGKWVQWLIDTNNGGDKRYYVDGEPTMQINTQKEITEKGECPYGKPGDNLWVRENMCENDEGIWCYAADDEWVGVNREDEGRMLSWVMHTERSICPSIHMPRWASRITLEVTNVRVERVQEISTEDACAEGILGCRDDLSNSHAVANFHHLWDSINAKRGYSWETNPWVWCVAFEVVQPCP